MPWVSNSGELLPLQPRRVKVREQQGASRQRGLCGDGSLVRAKDFAAGMQVTVAGPQRWGSQGDTHTDVTPLGILISSMAPPWLKTLGAVYTVNLMGHKQEKKGGECIWGSEWMFF